LGLEVGIHSQFRCLHRYQLKLWQGEGGRVVVMVMVRVRVRVG